VLDLQSPQGFHPPLRGSTSIMTVPEALPILWPTLSPGQRVNSSAMRSGSDDASLNPWGVVGCLPGSVHAIPFGQVHTPPSSTA